MRNKKNKLITKNIFFSQFYYFVKRVERGNSTGILITFANMLKIEKKVRFIYNKVIKTHEKNYQKMK